MQSKAESMVTRNIFLITDGEANNLNDILKFLSDHSGLVKTESVYWHNEGSTRCFCFGIGYQVSKKLVEGVVLASHGKAEFVIEGRKGIAEF